ncbi:MAG TPA: hypothetical protein VLG14_15295 [Sphingomonas sp.]|nr:hypothetical protein [Sphingomonas sp.]
MIDESNPTDEIDARPGKDEWVTPEIVAVEPISESHGGGGAGFDFASEVS